MWWSSMASLTRRGWFHVRPLSVGLVGRATLLNPEYSDDSSVPTRDKDGINNQAKKKIKFNKWILKFFELLPSPPIHKSGTAKIALAH